MDTQFTDLSVPNIDTEYYYTPIKKTAGFTFLMKLVLCAKQFPESTDIMKQIIKTDPEQKDKKNNHGCTALMIACINNDIETVKLLIDAGCNLNLQNNDNITALMYYLDCLSGDDELKIAEMLLCAGCNTDLQDDCGMTALMYVIENPNYNKNLKTKAIEMLINAGCNLDIQDNEGMSALMHLFAAFEPGSKTERIKMLLDANCNVNLQENNCTTLLNYLMCIDPESKSDVVNMLLDNGYDVNVLDDTGKTVLIIIILDQDTSNDTELLKKIILLSQKSLLTQDIYGKTAYDYYMIRELNSLDDYSLKVLKGEIILNTNV